MSDSISASDIHVLASGSVSREGSHIDSATEHDEDRDTKWTFANTEKVDIDQHFGKHGYTDVGEEEDASAKTKARRWSSPSHVDPLAARTHELLEKILETLSLSSAAGRVDRSTRARFWDMYKAEAEEFHADFLQKCNSGLDIALIFAGLFCGVDATFLTIMQPDLNADPNATTQILLMMVVQSLNSTMFADQPLVLPQFNGPDHMTIWIQCLLYASLAASLFAALGAMLGKQWLGHYAHITEKGTAEHRCIDRQRKFVGLQSWHFYAVLECLPSLLQMSLFLFMIGLAGYLWNQQRTISAVLIVAGAITILFYTFMIISSILYDDCPFRTPVSDALLRLGGQITHWVASAKKYIAQVFKTSEDRWQRRGRQSVSMGLLPLTAQHSLSMAHGRAYEMHQITVMDMLTTQPRDRLERTTRDPGMLTTRPTTLEEWTVSPERHLELSASCVSWLLVTSTHPDVITIAARMVLEVSWSSSRIDPLPMMSQLRDAFTLCFVRRLGRFNLAPFCHDRALSCGQALLHVYFQRWCVQESNTDPGAAEDVGQWLMQPLEFPTLWANDVTHDKHPDLFFIIHALQILADSSPLFLPPDKRRSRGELPKSEALQEWFSHEMVQCLASDRTPNRVKLLALDVFSEMFTRGLHSMFPKTYADVFLACAYGMGYVSPTSGFAGYQIGQTSDRPEEALASMLSQLTLTFTLQLQANVGLDPMHVTFAWELMSPLTYLCEHGSFREVLRSKYVHHLAILFCRTILEEHGLKNQSISERQWPWIDNWIRLGIMSTAPSRRQPVHSPRREVKLFKEDGFKRIWHCHYGSLDREYLQPSDLGWMLHVTREARSSEPVWGPHRVYLPRTIVYGLTMLCEHPDIINGTARNSVYPDIAWALREGGVFGQAGLKLARAVCGQDRDIDSSALTLLLHGTQQYLDLSTTLSTLLQSYYSSSDEFYGMAESYLLHMAYLDIVVGFIQLEVNLPAILSHIRNCFDIASLLRLNNHDWYGSESQMVRTCLGRQSDDRPRKQSSHLVAIDPNDNYPNSFIRDVWHRLTVVVAKFLREQPLPELTTTEDGILTTLALACACWQIYDTHPVPDDTLLAMTKLLGDVLSIKHDRVAEIDRQIEIQRTFRCISQVIIQDIHGLVPETRDIWNQARNILCAHVDVTVETLEPPLTLESLATNAER
ncbi:hypothetical protein BXZ70DRAFT_540880 [Cristinia sonorae]|uniref:DUF6535 domain-containing protein n=1 Tax=Cristinia sonorae TaxID=1940300 RepID=A0A8K0UFW3_9AGAR|nr:hypothetical protein BXZ70DRAFT_540880 [Cristinia sonorae]